MNKSYRIKLEEWLKTNTLTEELLLICIARLNPLIQELVYKEKKFAHVDHVYGSGNAEHIKKKNFYSDIRKPMMDILLRDYHLPFDTIVLKAKEIQENKLPTLKVCQQVKEIIDNGTYILN
jgi:hypothetical protein